MPGEYDSASCFLDCVHSYLRSQVLQFAEPVSAVYKARASSSICFDSNVAMLPFDMLGVENFLYKNTNAR